MILTDDEVKERIESPLNLLNRLKTSLNRTVSVPMLPPKAEDIVADLESKIRDSSLKSKAAGIMNIAMDELKHRMPEVQKPETLARIANEMSKVISNQETKGGGSTINSQIIVYAPQVQKLEDYDIIDVAEA